ncbi:hemagglutinin repeat-containing protein [Xanthomonas sp. CFBP 8445]|uniref:hemagglutinin repeat-containing protein n=1 Tax=Xanthomonas sp. CFBP 8445 TaxID=2971236 RepID=UPI0021DFC38A|nr:hemagglutinin repeat-containing protein [Xanthomonas sp. CFBP 8445]UYC12115.1 hemagglutinin repeat-containing protein [Xanthomonas sp. CFBP 8445]
MRTSIATGGSLQLATGDDLTIRQAQVQAGGNLIAAAGHDLDVTSVLGDSRTVTDSTARARPGSRLRPPPRTLTSRRSPPAATWCSAPVTTST